MRVTVLLPNYNNASSLKECLESLKNQTYTDFDLLIIDDGSTDDGVKIITDFPDTRIKLIQKEKNSGIIDTLNVGLKQINTEYIVRMDGDDRAHIERIEKLVHYMDNNPEIGVCGSATEEFGISTVTKSFDQSSEQIKANFIFNQLLVHPSVIIRKEILDQHDISYTDSYKYMEDFKFFFDLSRVTKITNIPDVLYYYRRENNEVYTEFAKNGFLKAFTSILTDLGFETSEKTVQLHYELARMPNKLTYTKKEYKQHCNRLVRKNNKLNFFPKKEFEKAIKKQYSTLFYVLFANNKLGFWSSFDFFISSPIKLYFFIKMKFFGNKRT